MERWATFVAGGRVAVDASVVVKPARPAGRTERLTLSITPALKLALETEAWEEQRSLSDYVRRLLERRGVWARTVGSGKTRHDLMNPLRPKDPE